MNTPDSHKFRTGKNNISYYFTEDQPSDEEPMSAAFLDVGQTFEENSNQSPLEKAVDALNEETGFLTPEINEATQALISGFNQTEVDKATMQQAWHEWGRLIGDFINSAPDEMRAKLQIAEILNKAEILLHSESPYRQLEELDLAELYARNFGLDELSDTLDSEINRQIELGTYEMNPTLLVVQLRGSVSEINREFMRDLIADGDDMEDVVTHAYNAILEEGGDPEETLREIGVLED